MSNELSSELQKQIDQEAKSSAASFNYYPESSECEDLESAYETGAKKYAELWQTAEASAKARGEIITQLNNRLTNLETALRKLRPGANSVDLAIIDEALTPKTSDDDTANG